MPFAAPVIVSFTMDSVSAAPTHPNHHHPNQHHPNQHHHHHKPVDVTKPLISGDPDEGSTLTAHHGKWKNDPTHFRYQWHRHHHGFHKHGSNAASASSGYRAIYGATGKTYNVSKHDVGFSLTVTVRGVNAAGVGDPATSRPVRVATPKPSKKPKHRRGFTG